MFERYTERARRVLFFGRYEASQLGSVTIDTEHLLLGLIREGKGPTNRIFARAHVSLEDIRHAVEKRSVFREKIPTSIEIPFSAACKRVLHFAAEEADRLRHAHIGTEHLLLGILREERSVAASILTDKGLRLPQVRDDIVQLSSAADADDASPDLESEGARPHRPSVPDFVPSTVVHIMRSHAGQPSFRRAPGGWEAIGFPLRRAVAELWHVRENRVEFRRLDDDTAYDIVVRLPRDEPRHTVEMLVRHAIEDQLGVAVTLEHDATDVFVVTAPHGPGRALRQHPEPEGGGVAAAYVSFSTKGAYEGAAPMFPMDGLALTESPMPMLCEMLEEILGLPVVDQTGLRGVFDLELKGLVPDRDFLISTLRDEAGLLLTLEHRQVPRIVVTRR